jgi:hypothetical protein
MSKLWNKNNSDVVESAIKMLAASRVMLTKIAELHQPMATFGYCKECFTEYPCQTIKLLDGEQ